MIVLNHRCHNLLVIFILITSSPCYLCQDVIDVSDETSDTLEPLTPPYRPHLILKSDPIDVNDDVDVTIPDKNHEIMRIYPWVSMCLSNIKCVVFSSLLFLLKSSTFSLHAKYKIELNR